MTRSSSVRPNGTFVEVSELESASNRSTISTRNINQIKTKKPANAAHIASVTDGPESRERRRAEGRGHSQKCSAFLKKRIEERKARNFMKYYERKAFLDYFVCVSLSV